MRALRFHAPGDVRLEEVRDPVAGPGDVLVRVEVALTDGTDLKAFRRGHPVLLGPPPSPFGHEFCGIDVATGRRVVAANSAPCGDCGPCRRGREAECERLLPLLNGAYAELIVVPERIARTNLLPVPPGLAPEVAAMVEPLACCLHGVDRAGIAAGDRVAVVGTGPVGLMLCACVADAGGRPVAVGGRPERQLLVVDAVGRHRHLRRPRETAEEEDGASRPDELERRAPRLLRPDRLDHDVRPRAVAGLGAEPA
ncbi:MAG TPA: alcohol dehydrogenase catalytic domain-containing protein, partial [Gaiellaceae bacterium]|nr:alcohol dehydrogenase catalytic domain-containing protein [Gaiellaceae bacterium]